ncbi:PTS sugar transporter subunit IIA [Salinicoccus roseus]|uniref:Mannitol-specific phosphotransferase enzyme IIA component n=1 Tax=Salinicoccus roseus TaxID=45670 RepID=A0A265E868_9STAP|nr:PTS sugar transporter subunit IIA [Salinicoccus roseus]OZT77626.1 PTS mannitol transporter subunit IIA [Salinicoccus roseus]RPE52771.1 PTS system D-mannitol-specific IIA component (Fru family) [Salinicoccus roseus]
MLKKENILMDQTAGSKEEAIEMAGRLLVQQGAVEEAYIDSMLEREKVVSTFMGNGLAIPHGTDEGKTSVIESGLSLVQVPGGVDFDGNEAKVVLGIAGKDNEHLDMLQKIAVLFSEEENAEQVINASSADEIIALFENEEI